jgi:hypothetical protein
MKTCEWKDCKNPAHVILERKGYHYNLCKTCSEWVIRFTRQLDNGLKLKAM